jgi:N-acetylglucosaminyldiphosphoundecaprenol N-acetyl-beta-D-mannosaminyltransferase
MSMVIASCDEVAEALQAELPSAAVYVPPVFDPADQSAFSDIVSATAQVLDGADPEFVFVGISYPKQQLLAFALIDQLRQRGRRPPVFLLIGGSFDMYVGRTPRAPVWMQRVGAEWFFRFLLEPRRLFHRYFVEDLRFLSIVWREYRMAQGPRRHLRPAGTAWRLSQMFTGRR